jgi:hypothetical protein
MDVPNQWESRHLSATFQLPARGLVRRVWAASQYGKHPVPIPAHGCIRANTPNADSHERTG